MTGTVRLRDGRRLAFDDVGAPSGRPVIFFHGLPDCRLLRGPDEATAQADVRLVAFDRPGFGRSDRQPGRTLSGIADDVVQLADHLGIAEFSVLGHSAGGPHALACAARLGDRVRAVGLLGSAAPTDLPGTDDLLNPLALMVRDGMRTDPEGTVEFGRLLVSGWAADVEAYVESSGAETTSAADRALYGSERALFIREAGEALSQGADGTVDEAPLVFGSWDFALGEVGTPVHAWHGEQDDVVAPELVRLMTDALPAGSFRLLPGVGHQLPLTGYWAELLGVLAAG